MKLRNYLKLKRMKSSDALKSKKTKIMLSSTEESLNLFVSSIYYLIVIISDRGYAFSQEPGQAPQITDNLMKRIKHSLSINLKRSLIPGGFVPKVISSNDNYIANVDSINHIMSNEDK